MTKASLTTKSVLLGATALSLTALPNMAALAQSAPPPPIVDLALTTRIDLPAGAMLTVTDAGSVDVEGSDGVRVNGDGVTITNNGLIRSNDDEAIEGSDRDNLTVVNTGTIIADEGGDKGIEANENLNITNSGRIESVTDEAIEADGPGLVLVNSGTIISPLDDAVDGDSDVMITNSGLIQGGENDAVELNNGTIINSGTIISLSSDPEGTPAVEGGPPELDAAIDFDAGTNGNEDGVVRNLAGGLIEGDIGIVASPGNVDSPDTNDGRQEVYNNGTITGRMGDAVLLGNGNDLFVQQETGVTNGVVNGQAGEDTLAFGNTGIGTFSVDLAMFGDESRFAGFENFGFLSAPAGVVTATGMSGLELTVFAGALQLDGDLTSTLTLAADTALTVGPMGSVNVEDDDGVRVDGDNVTIINNGLIRSNDDEAIEGGNRNNLTIINNGTIIADEGGDKGIEANENLNITNSGRIESVTDEAIEADGPGLILENSGMIISTVDDAVDGDDNVEIINSGLIQGGENDAIELNNGMITNSGTIISLSSDPEGTPAVEGGPPELDAAIDFDAGTDGNEDGVIMNLAGGRIEGDIGIVASPGNIDSPDTNDGRQQVFNAGTITGRMGDAALLGNGDDLFAQQMGGAVNGNINLQAGNDEFQLTGGPISSVTGMIDGGDGIDSAIIAGIYDADKLVNFETIAFNGVTFSGARTIVGDVTLSGATSFDLLPNNLFVQGDLTLAQGTIITIDAAGPITELQFNTPVLVVGQTGTFVNQGAVVNLIEDDLLVDYRVAFGSIVVTPVAVNPGAGSSDINVSALGAQIQAGLLTDRLNPAAAATINALPNAAAFEAAAGGLLPHLGTGISREIFESANIASRFLDTRFPKEGNGVWGQFAYRTSERDNRSATVSGYESDNYVFTLGADTAVLPGLTVGVVGSYADSDLTETSAAGEQIGLELFKIGGYAGFQTGSRFFINGEISYISADADTSRTSILGPITGAFDAEAWNFRAQAGLVYQVTENVTATPTVGINYLEIDFDDYVETGGFGFTVNRQDIQFVEGRLGLRLAGEWDKFTAQLQGNWAYDFDTDRRIVGLNSLTGVSDFAVTSDFISESRYEVDAGIGYRFMENASIDLVYNGEFADEAESHGGLVRVRFGF